MVATSVLGVIFALFGVISTVIFVGLAVVAITKFGDVREETDSSETASRTSADAPIQTLRERYARGEIGEDEFERKTERLLETEPGSTERDDSNLEFA